MASNDAVGLFDVVPSSGTTHARTRTHRFNYPFVPVILTRFCLSLLSVSQTGYQSVCPYHSCINWKFDVKRSSQTLLSRTSPFLTPYTLPPTPDPRQSSPRQHTESDLYRTARYTLYDHRKVLSEDRSFWGNHSDVLLCECLPCCGCRATEAEKSRWEVIKVNRQLSDFLCILSDFMYVQTSVCAYVLVALRVAYHNIHTFISIIIF